MEFLPTERWEIPPCFAVRQKVFARKRERVTPPRPERAIPHPHPRSLRSDARSLPLSGRQTIENVSCRRRGFTPNDRPCRGVPGAEVEGLKTYASVLDVPGTIDMATVYVPPEIGERVIEEIARKKIPEVWLNPGAESDALIARARALDIRPIVACSIVGIGENPYS